MQSEAPRRPRLDPSRNLKLLLDSPALRELTASEHNPRAFRKFCVTFFRGKSYDLSAGAQKPETFPKGHYFLSPRISTEIPIAHRVTDLSYLSLGSTDMHHSAILDAPFAYTIDTSQKDGTHTTISIIGFVPDFSSGTLRINQIQGGNGLTETTKKGHEMHKRRLEHSLRARMRLKQPELYALEQTIQLARDNGLSKIAIILPHRNKWDVVQTKVREKKHTVYDMCIGHLAGHYRSSEQDPYMIFYINEPVSNLHHEVQRDARERESNPLS